jgi:alpha-L-fucosidase
MKRIFLSLFLSFVLIVSKAQPEYQPAKENEDARKDFQNRKFGLFVHWGIYSLLGDGEWVMHAENIPYNNYSRLSSFFYPYAFDPKVWVNMVKAAGMKYITITSRHHDGFSMFQTKASPYNIVEATPYLKDPLKVLADECHRQGIKLFFYYSLLDWGRPDYGFGKSIVNGKPKETDEGTIDGAINQLWRNRRNLV